MATKTLIAMSGEAPSRSTIDQKRTRKGVVDPATLPSRLTKALLFRSAVPLSESALVQALGPEHDVWAMTTTVAGSEKVYKG